MHAQVCALLLLVYIRMAHLRTLFSDSKKIEIFRKKCKFLGNWVGKLTEVA